MKLRKLGRTGVEVGEVGLGTEHLNGQPRDTVVSVIGEALAGGVNYFDVLFSFPDYLDNLGAALRGHRSEVIVAGHLGCAETDGQYRRTREVRECESNFEDMLRRVGTDHADVLFLQNCDEEADYQELTGPGGLLEVAQRYREQGKARFVGISGHTVPVAWKAATSGLFDVLMFSMNPAFDSLAGNASIWEETGTGGASATEVPTRRALYHLCAREGVGMVAMKPFAGGKLLQQQEGRTRLTPAQCLSYVLAQPAVATAVPGPRNPDEVRGILSYLDASDSERDFGEVVARSEWSMEGSCVYCNHCLPCPSMIDVGATLRLLESAQQGISEELRSAYQELPAMASSCVECGECIARCPFRVNVTERLKHAVELFEL